MAGPDLSDVPYMFVGAVVAFQEELQRTADQLINKGKSLTPEGRKKMASAKQGLVSKGDDFSHVVARTVQRVLENAGLATHEDLEELDRRVDEVEKKVVTRKKVVVRPLVEKPAKPAAKKPAAKKKAPAKKKAAKKPAA